MIISYIRVSSKDQSIERQLLTVEKSNIKIDKYFIDRQSGKNFQRTAYQEMLEFIQPDDLLIIVSIDRLGRNYKEIIEQWRILTKEKKVNIKVLDMPLLDTSYGKDLLGTFISDLVLQILSFQAEQERNYIRERQKEGIEAAKLRNVKFGRPRAKLPGNFEELYERYKQGESCYSLSKEVESVSLSTLRKQLMERQLKDT